VPDNNRTPRFSRGPGAAAGQKYSGGSPTVPRCQTAVRQAHRKHKASLSRFGRPEERFDVVKRGVETLPKDDAVVVRLDKHVFAENVGVWYILLLP
jgi:hypothetical protein